MGRYIFFEKTLLYVKEVLSISSAIDKKNSHKFLFAHLSIRVNIILQIFFLPSFKANGRGFSWHKRGRGGGFFPIRDPGGLLKILSYLQLLIGATKSRGRGHQGGDMLSCFTCKHTKWVKASWTYSRYRIL